MSALLLLLPLLLISCGSASNMARRGRIIAQTTAPYDTYLETLPLPDDEMVVLRDTEEETLILERLRSDLTRAWSVQPAIEGELFLSHGPTFSPAKRRKEIRSPLFFDGTNIGLFYEVERGENRVLTLALFDADEGGLLRQVPLDTFSIRESRNPLRGGEFRVSPDQRSFAVYAYEYSHVLYGDNPGPAHLDVRLYSTKGEMIGSTVASINIGHEPADVDEVDAVLPPPLLTSGGEFIQPVVVLNELRAVVVEPRSGTSRVVPLIDFGEEEVGLVRVQPVAGSTVGVGAAIMDGDQVVGLSFATLDAERAAAGRSWRYMISDEQSDSLVEGDLDDFIFESLIVQPDGGTTFILEYQQVLVEVGGLGSRTYYYDNRDVAVFSFDPAGSLKNAVALDKEQRQLGVDRSILERSVAGGGLKFLVAHAELEELILATVPNGGKLTMTAIVRPEEDGRYKFAKSFWNDDNSVTFVIRDIWGDDARIVRVAMP